ncbi:23S rRNA (uracil(747)-C(5))-methyltransferase RlmC [Nocardioides zeae]|uniref:23S rRNA (Uracil(747)-C(5))-methyltransferase RlmC n=1 Tax=Nocardioides imazamoxiresistens TaxID=3231893 RepID=A0ABU3PY20_9ACTN|nr:23S rRNA (uracil(747)-C(5))-methyltransferase RlmC [Nocardioides zeae]MDT9594137.1 23S rRNA (uracil(747)-C(5))-methyltransferase RlmC [Nocardioides zeae]
MTVTPSRSVGLACGHYDRGECRSCGWLDRAYVDQLAAKDAHARSLLSRWADVEWLAPAASRREGFRNKAKMVVAGTADAPTLGILDPRGRGVDLRDCPLHEPAIVAALPALAEFVGRSRLEPYDVATRRGELKHLLVTAAPSGELMARLVLRSEEGVARIRKHLDVLQDDLPALAVVSVNLQPAHAALLEGDREIPLTASQTLAMRVNGIDLHLRPQSFFQTNTAVAAELYRQARAWVSEVDVDEAWDLYCGVGGFALHLAGADGAGAPARHVTGVEVSASAVESARRTAAEVGASARFLVGDATTAAAELGTAPDLVVVNPPRRGIGEELATWLERSPDVRTVLYSSCNATTLARDLATMPTLRPVRAQVLDMFPHTGHHEVLTLLRRA